MLMDSASLEQLVLDTSRSGPTSMACLCFPIFYAYFQFRPCAVELGRALITSQEIIPTDIASQERLYETSDSPKYVEYAPHS